MKKAAILILFLFLNSLYGIQENVPVLITGKILEISTNKPIGTDIKFIDENGKSAILKSNSLDGFYQQVLMSGKNYKMFLDGFIINGESNSFTIPSYQKYIEINKNFEVKQITNGLEILHNAAFLKNDSSLTPAGVESLKDLKEIISSQKAVIYLDIFLSTADSYFKTITQKQQVIEKGKKKTKNVTIHPHDQAKNLIESRRNVILDELKKVKVNSRLITFTEDLNYQKSEPKKAKPSKKGKAPIPETPVYTLKVNVSKVTKL